MANHELDHDDLYDQTLNINPNTDKLYQSTKAQVKKYFNYLNLPYEKIDDLPRDYDFKEFLGKFCSFRLSKCKVTKLNGLLPSLSSFYNLVIRYFPDVKAILEPSYLTLRKEMEKKFINDSSNAGTALVEHAAIPTEDDLLFISEQNWLGGIDDAPYRFAFMLNCHCGGRVSEV
jgi:hypothetical protein